MDKTLVEYLEGINIFDHLTYPLTVSTEILNNCLLGKYGKRIISPVAEINTPSQLASIAETLYHDKWSLIESLEDMELTGGICRTRTTSETTTSTGQTSDATTNSKTAFDSDTANENEATASNGTNDIEGTRQSTETETETNKDLRAIIDKMGLLPSNVESTIIDDLGKLATCEIYSL